MSRLSVLLVEDNQLLRWWMTSTLQRVGCCVVAPTSAEDALAVAGAARFDVLITDWRLADGHDGFEVLGRIRERFPETLAILISAEAGAELADRARSMGFDLVIAKPFPVAEIVAAVQSLATSHRPRVAS